MELNCIWLFLANKFKNFNKSIINCTKRIFFRKLFWKSSKYAGNTAEQLFQWKLILQIVQEISATYCPCWSQWETDLDPRDESFFLLLLCHLVFCLTFLTCLTCFPATNQQPVMTDFIYFDAALLYWRSNCNRNTANGNISWTILHYRVVFSAWDQEFMLVFHFFFRQVFSYVCKMTFTKYEEDVSGLT